MLQEEEFGSDSSDEDYKPGGESDVSEEEGEGVPEDFDAADEGSSGKSKVKSKRKRKQAVNPRKKKVLVLEGEVETAPEKDEGSETFKKAMEEEKKQKKEEEEKKKADDLFADFMKDVGKPKPRPKPAASGGLGALMSSTTPAGSAGAAQKAAPSAAAAPRTDKVTVTKVFDFAGETVTVTKDVDASSREAKKAAAAAGGTSSSQAAPKAAAPFRRGGGMAGLVKNLGKAPKMGVLEKSRLDWLGFKKEENLEEELEQHKRSKNSYLEKQDFLDRADQRQFELEKAVRDRHRTPR